MLAQLQCVLLWKQGLGEKKMFCIWDIRKYGVFRLSKSQTKLQAQHSLIQIQVVISKIYVSNSV